MNIGVGFTFIHPTQGTCTVTSEFRKRDGVRYTYSVEDWPAHYAVTTRSALRNLIAAGILSVPATQAAN